MILKQGRNSRGSKSNEKCPIQPADLVLLHNHIIEAMAKPDDQINDDFDFWSAVVNLKDPYLKYSKAYQSRVRTALNEFRFIRI